MPSPEKFKKSLEQFGIDPEVSARIGQGYEDICDRFKSYADTNNYDMVLRVFNEKTMLTQCGVAQMCGLKNKDEYIKTILNILKHNGREAKAIRTAVLKCFGLDEESLAKNN